jgi:hypothetical protein
VPVQSRAKLVENMKLPPTISLIRGHHQGVRGSLSSCERKTIPSREKANVLVLCMRRPM